MVELSYLDLLIAAILVLVLALVSIRLQSNISRQLVIAEYLRVHQAAVIWVSHDPEQVARVASRYFEMCDGNLQPRDIEVQ